MKLINTPFYTVFLAVLPLVPFTSHASTTDWFGYVSATYNDNYADDYRDDKSVDLDASLGYNINDNTSVSFSSTITYQNDQFCSSHDTDYWCMANSYVYLKRNNLYDFSDNITLGLNGRLLIPTSKYSQDSHLYTALGAYLPLSINMDEFVSGLSFSLTPSLNKYFNKYKTAGNKNLTEYTAALSLTSIYTYSDWSFYANATESQYRTYKGYYKYPSIDITLELDYQMSEHIGMAAGYSNNAQYYSPDKGANPINDLFDDKDPSFYASVNYSF